ncbi:MAG: SH3 domain-containing protein, partial [Anaerolineae bacterium]|nr:SH3 domain-containing protein [Anaerolineae bacterium]
AESVELNGYPRERITIAPDGGAIAYADSVLHILFSDGSVAEIANSDSFADDFSARILWGATQWRVAGTAQPVQIPLPVCDGAQPSRLRAMDQGRVISETVPMNVRAEPTTSGSLIGQIPGGETFTVLSQAVCANGYAWAQVRYADFEGWVAEAGSEYFLEPDQR